MAAHWVLSKLDRPSFAQVLILGDHRWVFPGHGARVNTLGKVSTVGQFVNQDDFRGSDTDAVSQVYGLEGVVVNNEA